MWRELSDQERERLRAAQRVIQHAVAAASDDDVHLAQQQQFRSLGVDPQDGAALTRVDPRHLLVYRKLVRGTMHDAVAAQLPRTVAWMGPEAYESTVADYCEQQLPHSRILRDVAYELAAWAAPRWRDDASLPSALADLARYELFCFDVLTAEREPAVAQPWSVDHDVGANQTIAFDGTVRLARFRHRVHELGELVPGEPGPAQLSAVALLGYRDASGEYRELELTPLAADILERLLLQGEPLAGAVGDACRAAGLSPEPRIIEGISQLLADLSERGAALGGREPGPLPHPSPFFRWLLDGEMGTPIR